MSRFYIKKIAASGNDVICSEIVFNNGVNIVYGPSNSGKSYIINCINFMFAGDIPFTKAATGYDTILMVMESTDGHSISLERKIVDGKNGEVGARFVNVISDYEPVKSQIYKIKDNEFSNLLLELIGINPGHKIIVDENYKTQCITVRQLIHFFFIDEENILRKTTIFDTPKYSRINANLCLLNFLITGDDSNWLVTSANKKEMENKVIQRAGILNYIKQKLSELNDRKKALENETNIEHEDTELQIENIFARIEDVEKKIIEASNESRIIVQRICKVNLKLEEANILKSQYENLKSQYDADIKRLEFIQEGELNEKYIDELETCPFCRQNIAIETNSYVSYMEVISIELKRIEIQIKDLLEAESDVDNRIEELEEELAELREKNEKINFVIKEKLTPQAHTLKQMVIDYKRFLKVEQEIAALDIMLAELNKDAVKKENEGDAKIEKFSGRKLISKEIWLELSALFGEMVKKCGYPVDSESYIDIKTVDAVINGKHKKDEGKGYRAFINTIMLFNLMKFLETKAVYAPHMLILDSPILSLKEKKHNIAKDEEISLGMRESLFEYIVKNCGNNQIIIAENEIPSNVDYSTANLIEFTLDSSTGIYGFLKGKK